VNTPEFGPLDGLTDAQRLAARREELNDEYRSGLDCPDTIDDEDDEE
jgi:hypothetical protein